MQYNSAEPAVYIYNSLLQQNMHNFIFARN